MKTIVVTVIEDGVISSVRKVEMGATPTYGAIETSKEDKQAIARIAGVTYKEPPIIVEPIPEPKPAPPATVFDDVTKGYVP